MALITGSLAQRLGLALASYLGQDEERPEGMPLVADLPVFGFVTRELTTVPAICVSVVDAEERDAAMPGARQARVQVEVIHAVDDAAEAGLEEHRTAAAGVAEMLGEGRDAVIAYVGGGAEDDWELHLYDVWLEGMPTETAERAVRTLMTVGVILHDLAGEP